VNRRVFLQGMALLAVAAAAGGMRTATQAQGASSVQAGAALRAAPAASSVAQAAPQQWILGRLLKGTPYGQVQESTDGGRSWRKVANFGSHVSVARLYEHQAEIHAQIVLEGHSFTLRSADGRRWWTADAMRRSA
jgi:photosystem II stability/assembly factor-like uncharacterized protein